MAANSTLNLNTNFFFFTIKTFSTEKSRSLILNDSYELQVHTVRSTTLFFHFRKKTVNDGQLDIRKEAEVVW